MALKIRVHESKGKDPRITKIISLIPTDGKWTPQAEERICDELDNALSKALGDTYEIQYGQDDDNIYTFYIYYDNCVVSLKVENGGTYGGMEVQAYYDDGKRQSNTWTKELDSLDDLHDVVNDLCDKAKTDV